MKVLIDNYFKYIPFLGLLTWFIYHQYILRERYYFKAIDYVYHMNAALIVHLLLIHFSR